MQIIYSTSRVANPGGRTVKNPRHFAGPVKGATKVYVNGDFPAISASYKEAGVPVADVSEMPGYGKAKAEAAKPAPTPAPAPKPAS